jgi:hypothetical protein
MSGSATVARRGSEFPALGLHARLASSKEAGALYHYSMAGTGPPAMNGPDAAA